MGVIKECGGKMWMGERESLSRALCSKKLMDCLLGQWNRASEDFFESFRNYDEAGSPQRIQVLKYLVLASGFSRAELEYRTPVPPQDRLQTIASAGNVDGAELVDAFNANVEKLNSRLFTYLDYAVIGVR